MKQHSQEIVLLMNVMKYNFHPHHLTYWGWDKMAAIAQTIFLDAFSRIKS